MFGNDISGGEGTGKSSVGTGIGEEKITACGWETSALGSFETGLEGDLSGLSPDIKKEAEPRVDFMAEGDKRCFRRGRNLQSLMRWPV